MSDDASIEALTKAIEAMKEQWKEEKENAEKAAFQSATKKGIVGAEYFAGNCADVLACLLELLLLKGVLTAEEAEPLLLRIAPPDTGAFRTGALSRVLGTIPAQTSTRESQREAEAAALARMSDTTEMEPEVEEG